MASDYVLYHARHTAEGEKKMDVISGSVNVRSGYGNPTLKSVRALYKSSDGGATSRTSVELRNSNWVRSLDVIAAEWSAATSLGTETFGFSSGRDAPLKANSSFNIVSNTIGALTGGATRDVYCLVEIDYSDVPTNNVKTARGFPMTVKEYLSGAVVPNTQIHLKAVDNLDPGVEYLLSEVRFNHSVQTGHTQPMFIILSGVQTMRGLNVIIPVKRSGQDLVPQYETSVKWTKQSYNIGLITSITESSFWADLVLEFVASGNSV